MEKTMTVHDVSRLTGISIRTLQYYDRIGLFPPSSYSGAGYRLYDEECLARLQMILLFRELEFPLKDIKTILDSPDFDRNRALEQQIRLLEMKKEHTENLILLARGMKLMGVEYMKNKQKADFKAFDTAKIDEYAAQAKASWGNTPQWKEYEQKRKEAKEDLNAAGERMMTEIFGEFGRIKEKDPASEEAQDLVKKLQAFITEHFYTCTKEVLSGLGKMYAGGGEFTANIDAAGGEGTAVFAHRAIEVYCNG
jgi:DNA-binding transcriptional MerR regulator